MKLSQADFAGLVGVSRFQVIKWESGRDQPGAERLQKIADTLGVPLPWLMNGGELQKVPIQDFTKNASPQVQSAWADIKRQLASIEKKVEVAQKAELAFSPAEDLIHSIVSLMPRFKMDAIPHFGVAAADEQDGRQYDGEAESGMMTSPDALEPRVVTVRGASAQDFAWDGQQCVIDIAHTNVGVGDLCVILTQDKCLRLKRKAKDRGKLRTYVSINREFPAFEVLARNVVAEFPVVTVLVKTKTTSPVETINEGFPV